MKFTKMHGLGNDYIFLNCMDAILPGDPPALARRLSDRHFGVGGDGLICICPSETADFRMRIYNADGSEGAMCGNGIRCAGKYFYDRGLTSKRNVTVETLAGVRALELHLQDGRVDGVTVDMGVPKVGKQYTICVKEEIYTGIEVSMGNPHFAVPVPDPASVELPAVGAAMERDPQFPGGVNVEFVRAAGRDRVEMRVWERGSGETMACGTGACAALAALAALGQVDPVVTVSLPGGSLEILYRERDGHMLMTGPAVTVFDGELCQEVWDGADQ